MQELKVTAEVRENAGAKGTLSKIRADKKIPAVIYGGKKEPVSISITEKDLAAILKVGGNAVVALQLPSGVENAIIKEVQYHVVKDTPNHVDFLRVSMTDKIEVIVPVRLQGEPESVKTHGAMINQVLRELHVRCLPADIPQEFVLDISGMNMNEPLYIADLKLGKDMEVIGDAERAIVHLTVPREEEEAAASADAAAQPESSSTKGKKDEEGSKESK